MHHNGADVSFTDCLDIALKHRDSSDDAKLQSSWTWLQKTLAEQAQSMVGTGSRADGHSIFTCRCRSNSDKQRDRQLHVFQRALADVWCCDHLPCASDFTVPVIIAECGIQ